MSLFGGDGPTAFDMEVFFYGLAVVKGDGDEQTHSVPFVDLACSVDCRIIWGRVGCLGLLPLSWPVSRVFNVSLRIKPKFHFPTVLPNLRFDAWFPICRQGEHIDM